MALVLVLTTAVWNALRVWSILDWAALFDKYAPWPGPIYIGVTGAAFVGVAGAVLYGHWRRAAWAPRALLAGAWAYAAWSWADRLLVQPQLSPAWPFTLAVTLLLLTFVSAVALDPRNQYYFGREAHGREKQDRPAA